LLQIRDAERRSEAREGEVDDWQIAVFIVLVVLADIPVLFWIFRHRSRHLAKAREDYDRWRARLDSDPRLKRLYEAHRRARWRVALAQLVDLLASMTATVVVWSLVTGEGALARFKTGISEAELVALLLGWGAVYLTLQFWVFPRLRTTLGLWLLGLVAVSPWEGTPVRDQLVPTEWDYRADRVPGRLFVPREEFEAAWGGFPPP